METRRGWCDRCGRPFELKTLRSDGHKKGLLVCRYCWDPQDRRQKRRKQDFNDPKAIKNPRPNQRVDDHDSTKGVRYYGEAPGGSEWHDDGFLIAEGEDGSQSEFPHFSGGPVAWIDGYLFWAYNDTADIDPRSNWSVVRYDVSEHGVEANTRREILTDLQIVRSMTSVGDRLFIATGGAIQEYNTEGERVGGGVSLPFHEVAMYLSQDGRYLFGSNGVRLELYRLERPFGFADRTLLETLDIPDIQAMDARGSNFFMANSDTLFHYRMEIPNKLSSLKLVDSWKLPPTGFDYVGLALMDSHGVALSVDGPYVDFFEQRPFRGVFSDPEKALNYVKTDWSSVQTVLSKWQVEVGLDVSGQVTEILGEPTRT